MIRYLALFCFLTFALTLVGQDSLFYSNKYRDYADAGYEYARKHGDSPGNSFNIAIAEWKDKRIAEAMLEIEKAKRLSPLNQKINVKWKEIRRDIKEPVSPIPPFFLSTWLKGLAMILRPGMWAVLSLLFAGLLIWFYFKDGRKSRRLGRILLVASLLLISIVGMISSYQILFDDTEGIIWKETELRVAASENSPSKRMLSIGETIEITDQIGNLYHVILLNKESGWVKESDLKRITIIPRP